MKLQFVTSVLLFWILHLKADGSLDHEKLRDTIQIAVRALDNVIDVNFYPTDAAKTSNSRHRDWARGNGLTKRSFHQKHTL